MAKHLIITILLLIPRQFAVGQVFCLSEKQFTFPEIALRAGMSSTFQVRFDVVEFSPRNIEVSAFDTISQSRINLFQESIAQNLRKFTYLSDTAGLELILKYVSLDPLWSTTDFTERVSDIEVRFVVRRPQPFVDYAIPLVEPDLAVDSQNDRSRTSA